MVDESQFNLSSGWENPNCECLPGCNELSYVSSMTYSHMNATHAVNRGFVDGAVLNDTDAR
jgi:hypothetical protein